MITIILNLVFIINETNIEKENLYNTCAELHYIKAEDKYKKLNCEQFFTY